MKVDVRSRNRAGHGQRAKTNIQSDWLNTDQIFRRTCLSAMLAACFDMAAANPTGPQVVHGLATFNNAGNTLSVTNTPNTIIDWASFSINPGELTRFIQQNANSSVLNRIGGQNPSQILGALQSNGKVFLINPNGVLFGAGSQIDVNGLVASSLNLSNSDFLNGKLNFSQAAISGNVSNKGVITTPAGGQVFLIAPNVDNSGIITAPNGQVILAAGHTVQLVDSGNPDLHVVVSSPADQAINLGRIVAQAGKIGIYGALVRQRGVVNADSAVIGANGKVVLKASHDSLLEAGSLTSAQGEGSGGTVEVLGQRVGLLGDARVDASGNAGGGTVLLGGDFQGSNAAVPNAQFTYVSPQASVRADARQSGDGGKVIAWSDQGTQVYGSIDARGGLAGGSGGLVETSGKLRLDVDGALVRAAARGNGAADKNGQWLLDPSDVTIMHGATGSLSAGVFDPPSSSSIGDTQINTALAGGTDVTIQTSGGTGGTGLIRVNGDADSGGAADIANRGGGTRGLTLITSGAIDIRSGASIAGQNTDPLNLTLSASGGITINGTIDNMGGTTSLAGATTLGGSIRHATLSSANTLTGGTGTLTGVTISGTLGMAGGMFVENDLTLANGAVLNLGNGTLYMRSPGIQHFAASGSGTMNLAGATIYGGYYGTGQTLQIDSGVTLQGYGGVFDSSPASLINNGSIIANTPSQTFSLMSSSLNNAGSLTANAGSMTIGHINWNNSGSMAVASGATLNLNFDTTTANLGTITRTGGLVTYNGVLDNTQNMLDIGGGGIFGSGGLSTLFGTIKNGTVTSGDSSVLTASGGTLDNVIVLGTLGVSGSLYVQNNITLGKAATLNLGNSSLYFKSAGVQHVASGGTSTINSAGATIYAGYGVAGQTLELDSGVTLLGYGGVYDSTAATFLNSGNINANTNAQTFVVGATNVINTGSLQAGGGTLTINHVGWSNSGSMAVSGSGRLNLNMDTTTAGLGTVTRSGGSVYYNGILDNTSALLDIGGSGAFGSGGLSGLGGTIKNGTVLSSDSTVLAGSNAFLDGVTVSGTLATSGGLAIKHDLTLAAGATLNLANTNLYFEGSGTQHVASGGSSTINLSGGALYAGYGVSGQTLQFDSGVTLAGYGGIYDSSPASVINAGAINANTTGQTFNIAPTSFSNSGSLQANNGTMTVNHIGWSNSGNMAVSGSGRLNLNMDTTTAGLGTVTRSGGSVYFNGILDNTSATLDIGGSGAFGSGGLSGFGGTIKNGTLLSSDSTVLASSGTLDGVTLSGTLGASGGLAIKHDLTLAPGAALNLGSSSVYFQGSGTQHVATGGSASINMAGATLYAGYGVTGQTLQFDSGVTLAGYGGLYDSSPATVINAGSINANTTSQTLNIGPTSFSNTGSLQASNGTLNIGHIGWSNSGSINVASGGILTTAFDTTTAGFGSVTRSGGSVNLNGVLDNSGNTLDIGGSGIFGAGGLTHLGGSIKNGTLKSGDSSVLNTNGKLDGVTVSGSLDVSGSMEVLNGLTLANGASLNLGSTSVYFESGGTQHIASPGSAAVTMAGSTVYAGYGVTGQTLQIDSGVTLQGYGYLGESQVATINNAGTISATNGSQVLTITPTTFNNSGTLRAAGLLTVGHIGWSNTGTVAVAAGGILNAYMDTTTAALGTFTRTGGSINYFGVLDNTAATLDIGGSGVFGSGGLSSLSGTIKNGTLISSDSTVLTASGATLDGVTMSGNLGFGGSAFIKNGITLANASTINLGTGYWYFTDAGTTEHVATPGSATLNMAAGVWYGGYGVNGQTLQIDSGVTLQGYGTLLQSSPANLVNNGTINANLAAHTLSLGFTGITNNGSLRADAGTLSLSGFSSNNGALAMAAGATINTNNAGLTNNAGAVIRGSGTLELGSGTLTNNGSIEPGGSGAVGTLNIHGNFVQGSTGSLAMEAGPTASDHDVLTISGTAALNGSLNLSVLSGYNPANGDQFPLLTFSGNASGTFATINAAVFTGATPDYATNGSFLLKMPNGALINIWNFDGNGNWNDPTKWSLGHVPTVNEDVQVPDYSSQFTVSIAANAQLAKSVVFAGNDKLAVSGGSLSVTNASNLSSGTLDLSATGIYNSGGNLSAKALNISGTSALNLGTGVTLSVFDHTQSGGSITGVANVVIANSYNRSGGTFASSLTGLDITQTSGNLAPGALSVAGQLMLRASNGDITIDQPLAAPASSISLAAPQGAITASGGGSITAPVLVMSAQSGIGNGTPLNTSVSALQALNSGSGDIVVHNAVTSLAITDVTSAGYGVKQQGSGKIDITGGAIGLDIHAPLLTAGGDVNLNAATIVFNNSNSAKIDAGNGSVLLRASGPAGIVMPAQSSIKINGSGVSSTRVQLEADSLTLAGSIDAGLITGTGYVDIAPVSTVPLVVESGRGGGHLSLLPAELGHISASGLSLTNYNGNAGVTFADALGLSAVQNLQVFTNGTIAVDAPLAVSGANGYINLVPTGGNLTLGANGSVAANLITVQEAHAIDLNNAAAASFGVAGGNVLLLADHLRLGNNAPINLGSSGTLKIGPNSAATPIGIVSAPDVNSPDLQLSNTELGSVVAGAITIGRDSTQHGSGTLTVAAPLTTNAAVNTLTLQAGCDSGSNCAGITQSAGGVITTPSLVLSSNGAQLNLAANAVDSLAAEAFSGGSGIAFANGKSLTISGSGILAPGQPVDLSVPANYALTIAQAVNANSCTVTLQADTLNLNNSISANTVQISATSAGRAVTLGSATCTTAPCLAVSNLYQLAAPNLVIGDTASGGQIDVAGVTLGGNGAADRNAATTRIDLLSHSGIAQSGSIKVANLGIDAGGTVALGLTNHVGHLAGSSVGDFAFSNGGNLSIDSLAAVGRSAAHSGVNAGSGNLLLSSGGDLTLVNALSGNAITLTSNGVLSGSGNVSGSSLNASAVNGITLNTTVASLTASNTSSGNIAVTNGVPMILHNVTESGSGSITIDNTGAMTESGAVSSGSGAISLLTHSPLTIDGSVTSSGGGAITLRAGSSNSNSDILTINSTATVTSSGPVTLQAGAAVNVSQGSTVSPQAVTQPMQNATLPNINTCISAPATARCGEVLPLLSSCISAPATLGCSVVLPTLATCIASPGAAGCSVVLPSLGSCMAAPSTAGCSAVLPSLASCTASPATAGCSVVLPTLAACTAAPSTPGCTAVLPTLANCTATPSIPGCSAVLPTLAACISAPATAGCAAVLPSIATCSVNPATPGCSVVLPTLASCISAPATPGCTAVLPTLAACSVTPELPGCSVVLPTIATCTSAPATPGCSAVLPSLASCISNPAASGCSAVLPNLAACSATPSLPGCSVVLPDLATCSAAPATPGCAVVLPNIATCTSAPSTPGCSVILPTLENCTSNPALAGCTAVLPTLATCSANPAAAGCSAVLPNLATCISNPAAAGCSAVLPNLAACISNPQASGCTAVLPTLTACASTPGLPGCSVVLPNLATCISNPAASGCSVVLPTLASCISAPTSAGCSAVLPSLATCTATPSVPGCSVVLPNIADCLTNPAASGCQVVVTPADGNTNNSDLNHALNNTVEIVTNIATPKPVTQPVVLAVLTPPANPDPAPSTTPATTPASQPATTPGSDKPVDSKVTDSKPADKPADSKADDSKKDDSKKDDSVKVAAKPEAKKEEPAKKLYCN